MSRSGSNRIDAECPTAMENIKVEGDTADGNVKHGRRSSSISDSAHNNGSCDNGGELFGEMPEEFSCLGDGGFGESGMGSKSHKLQKIIEDSISSDSKQTVSEILDQVNGLSTAEKLLLYLRLPSSKGEPIDPLRQPLNPLGNRFEIHQTITWIRTHLEEDQDVSLPKQDVYEEYTAYCNNNTMKPLSTADFGKVMKQVFPSVRPRRLGTRGNSRYCYAGMRKRTSLQVPLLPDLAGDCTKPNVNVGSDAEVLTAASCLVREWAEKLLSVKFDTLQDLACHLVENLCVGSRSVSALTLLSALEPNHQGVVSPSLQPGSKQVSKHRETQLQLQRKLQEREVIREQKRKLQVQQQSSGRSSSAGDKPRAKRPKLSRQNSVEDVKPAASTSTPPTQETTHAASRSDNRPPSNCDKKQPAANRFANGKEEFVDYSTIGLEDNSGNVDDGVSRGGNRFADFCKVVHGSNNNDERKVSVNSSNDDGNLKAPSRFPEKSRHLSLDFERSDNVTSPQFGKTFQMPVEGQTALERQKSSLRFYLEHTPAKKPEGVSPEMDFNNDLLPNLLKSQISPPAVPGSSPLVPPAAHPPQSEGKVLIPRLPKPRRETPTNLVIFPPAPVTHSPKHKYKPIQPKVDPLSRDIDTDELLSPAMGKEGSAFFPPNAKKSPVKQKPLINKSIQAKSPPKKPRTPKTNSTSKKTTKTAGNDAQPSAIAIPPRARNEVSIGCLEKDALDDYLHGGSNSQEQEEELLQIFQQGSSPSAPAPPADNNNEKLSQLRLLLERNITSAASRPAAADHSRPHVGHSASQSLSMLSHRNQLQQRVNLAMPSMHADGYNPSVGTRRRVSFETSVVDNPVPQSPNTRRRVFSFTPISPGPHSPLGRATSKPSSANASPFVSPRNTPVPRSRNNSTQAKSHGSFLASMLNGGGRGQHAGALPTADGSGSQVNGGRSLASFAGQSLNSLMANGSAKSKRQSLQRSSSVNSELASRYLGATLSINTANTMYPARDVRTGCDTFAMPPEQGPAADGDPFARHYGQISASAPQSPLVHYHSPNVNPFTFKARANSFEGPTSQLLLEEMLRSQQQANVDTFMGSNAGVVSNQTSMADVDAVEATLMRQQTDSLSHEVSQFSAESDSISNFAAMQYRSQSVPLHRMTDALISPRNGTFTYTSAATSMAPTPVPSEYQDFGPDTLLDSAEINDGGLNSENLNQIFNLLDAQEDTQIKLDPEESVGITENVSCLNAADINDVVLNGEKLRGTFDETLILPQGYETLVTNGQQQQAYVGADMNADGQMSMDVDEELSPSYDNAPLPYKSTFEYVTDGTYRTFALGAAGENGCGARRNINVLLEPTYYADELNGVLPSMADGDHVSQLEQQVDKL